MSKSNIGIIGYGVVGQALHQGFKEHSVLFFDKYKDSTPIEEVAQKSDFIFVVLPTPMFADESGIDLSAIEENIALITPITDNSEKIIIIKSTVTPGTTKYFQEKYPNSKFAFNPEFLTESNFIQDFLNAPRTVIGAFNQRVLDRLSELYQSVFPQTKIYRADPTSAELAKDMANAYLALKVSFANQLNDYCESLGIDFETVKNLIVTDSRIVDTHLSISKDRGYGGKCFPKDTVGLIAAAKEKAVDLSIIKEAWEYNKKIRKNRDWENIPFAISPRKSDK